jgi:hypothetical protein
MKNQRKNFEYFEAIKFKEKPAHKLINESNQEDDMHNEKTIFKTKLLDELMMENNQLSEKNKILSDLYEKTVMVRLRYFKTKIKFGKEENINSMSQSQSIKLFRAKYLIENI